MNNANESAAKLLEALADVDEIFSRFAASLRMRQHVSSVTHEMSPKKYGSKLILEAYVDAEMTNGESVGWWLEVHYDGMKWTIRYSVRLTHENGEDVVQNFSDILVTTLDGFAEQIVAAAKTLTDYSNRVENG